MGHSYKFCSMKGVKREPRIRVSPSTPCLDGEKIGFRHCYTDSLEDEEVATLVAVKCFTQCQICVKLAAFHSDNIENGSRFLRNAWLHLWNAISFSGCDNNGIIASITQYLLAISIRIFNTWPDYFLFNTNDRQ
jgi:hypothetical protein